MKPVDTTNPYRIGRTAFIAAVCGIAVLASGAMVDPDRVWGNALVAAFFVATLGLGGAVFLALTGVSGARWHLEMRHIPRRMTALLPWGTIALLVVLALQLPRYAWHHHGDGDAGTFWFKELWLSETFFFARAVAIVVIWMLITRWTAAVSRRTPGERPDGRGPASAICVVLFALTFSVASWDWFMALEPLWFSTIWAVYHFSGLVTATLAVIVLIGIASRSSRSRPGDFTDDHLHDLGQLLFGFSCFWMYIWYSQYMLIWYTNIPEEAVYFARRTDGAWGPIMTVNVILNFGIPFLVLLPKPNKRSTSVMAKVAAIVLIGRWLDLCLMVFPVTSGETPVFGIWELAALVSAGGILLAFLPTIERNSEVLVPQQS